MSNSIINKLGAHLVAQWCHLLVKLDLTHKHFYFVYLVHTVNRRSVILTEVFSADSGNTFVKINR